MEDLIKNPYRIQTSLKKNSGSEQSFKLQNDSNNEENIKSRLNDYLSCNKNLAKNFIINEKNLKNLKILISQNPSEECKTQITQFYLKKITLAKKINSLITENLVLKSKLQNVQNQPRKKNHSKKSQKKRVRKLKEQVIRNFKCQSINCNKAYGSENSLNQHIKLKHNDFWKKNKYTEEKDDNIYCEEKDEAADGNGPEFGVVANREFGNFRNNTDDNSENQVDFDKILENLWID